MKRRWFGVALALWAVVAPLVALVSAPVAYADNEQFTFDTGYANGVVYYFIRGINGAFKSGAELRAVVGSANIGSLPAGKVVPNTYSTSAALGALDGGCGQIQITNVNPSGTAGVFTATLQNSGNLCAIPQGAIKVYDPNNALGTGSADAPVAGGTGGTSGDDPPPDCDAGPATFMVCDFISKPLLGAIDWIRDTIIVPFLREKPLDKNDKDVLPVYKIWSSLRNVASVFFILVFFLVIFGTAIGWDNYTVKKILPRLIAGAILVPFSWYICVIIIDVGNVLGQGLVGLISPLIPTSTIDFSSPFTKIFLGTALLGIGAIAIASISAGVIVSLFIGFLAVFFTLVLRKILIILMVILSPLAVLAWILPNTSKWFKEWWDNFFKLVMMYPIIMLLFEAGRLFAATAGATFGNGLADKTIAPLIQVVGLTLPLFGVPFAAAIAGKGLQTASRGVGKAMNAADKQFGKGSDWAENKQNKWAAKAADKTKGNAISRGIWRLGSGTASPTRSASARAAMQARAEKHIGLMSHDQGHHKATHDILNEADKMEAAGDKEGAAALRKSISTAGRIEYGAAQETTKQAAAAAQIQGYNKAKKEIGETAAQSRDAASKARARADAANKAAGEAELRGATTEAANFRAEAERANIEAADHDLRAERLDSAMTTVGQMKYDASKAKSAVIGDKAAVVAYNQGKAELEASAKAADTRAAKATAAAKVAATKGATAEAAQLNAEAQAHTDEANKIRAAIGTPGKMRYEIDQGRDKMIADKSAIKAHLESPAEVEATAKAAEGRAAAASARAAAANRKATAATLRGDTTTATEATSEAQRAASEARTATAEAANLRSTLTTSGKLGYQAEQGTRRIVGEKAQMAAYNQARTEVQATADAADARAKDATGRAAEANQRAVVARTAATAAAYSPDAAASLIDKAHKAEVLAQEAQGEATLESERAVNLRQNLTVSGRMAMQVSQEKQNVVAEQAKLEALRRANEISTHDTGRQLEAQATVQAKGVLDSRTQEAEMEEVVIRDASGREVTRGKVGNVDIGSETVAQFKAEASNAIRSGDQARAAAYLKSLTRTSSGRDALRQIQYEEFGGTDNDTIQPELKDLWERAVANNVGDKAPDLKLPRIAAFTDVKPQDFLKFDKRTKKAYLTWVEKKHPEYIGEAANAIAVASSERLRSNLDDADIQLMEESGFLQRHAAEIEAVNPNDFRYLSQRRDRIMANPQPEHDSED